MLFNSLNRINNGSSDPLFGSVVFLANFENNFEDVKGAAFTNFGASLVTGAIQTNGVNQYISYTSNDNIKLNVPNWTVEIIIDPSVTIAGGSFLQKGRYETYGAWSSGGYAIRPIGNGVIRAYFDTTSSLYTEKYIDFNHSTSPGKLHIALVKNGSQGSIFSNGINVGNISLNNTITQSDHALEIGRFDYGIGPIYQQTKMFAVRISSTNRYTANFEPPLEFLEN